MFWLLSGLTVGWCASAGLAYAGFRFRQGNGLVYQFVLRPVVSVQMAGFYAIVLNLVLVVFVSKLQAGMIFCFLLLCLTWLRPPDICFLLEFFGYNW